MATPSSMSKMTESTDIVVVFCTFFLSLTGTYMTARRGKNSDLRGPSPPPLPWATHSPVATVVWCMEMLFLVFLLVVVVHKVKFLTVVRLEEGNCCCRSRDAHVHPAVQPRTGRVAIAVPRKDMRRVTAIASES